MRFPGHFSKISFSCYMVWKHPKTTHGGHFWGCWAFFPRSRAIFLKISQIWIFLPFWQNMLLGWLKNDSKCYAALKTGVWRCKTWQKISLTYFDLFLTCLLTIWRFFCLVKKIREGVSEKKFFGQNLIRHMQNVI